MESEDGAEERESEERAAGHGGGDSGVMIPPLLWRCRPVSKACTAGGGMSGLGSSSGGKRAVCKVIVRGLCTAASTTG